MVSAGIYNYSLNLSENNTGRSDQYPACFCIIGRLLVTSIIAAAFSLISQAQDSLLCTKITVADTTCSIESALEIIGPKAGISFTYNSEMIGANRIINLKANHEELIKVLKRVLNDPTLNYKVIGKHIVIYQPVRTASAIPERKTDSVYYFTINGQVLDKSNQEAVPYASVFLIGKSNGMVANNDGLFTLKLSTVNLKDTLGISCIGYKRYMAPVSSLINGDHKFYLITDVIPIQEVIIRQLSPLSLLQNAIDKVPYNYPLNPSLLTSFYREAIKRGSKYMMVSEAILETYKSPYNLPVESDRIRIVKGRKSEDISQNDTVMLKLKAGLNTTLLLDLVKNPPDFMTSEGERQYNYKLADIVSDNNRENYVISFSPKQNTTDNYYTGRIYLDLNDLAFTNVDFSIDPDKLDVASGLFVVKKPAYMKVRVLQANYKVTFRKIGNRYYLYLIRCETEFRVRLRKQLLGSTYSTTLEMVVTNVDTADVNRVRFKEMAKTNEIFTEQLSGEPDEAFWGEYNYIRPDEPLEEALKRLKITSIQTENK